MPPRPDPEEAVSTVYLKKAVKDINKQLTGISVLDGEVYENLKQVLTEVDKYAEWVEHVNKTYGDKYESSEENIFLKYARKENLSIESQLESMVRELHDLNFATINVRVKT